VAAYNITDIALGSQLEPGDKVLRDATMLGEECCVLRVPCCDRELRILPPGKDEESPAACCRCGVVYLVGLEPEENWDDEMDYVIAKLEVKYTQIAMVNHRKSKAEKEGRVR
jgi:hypothetical protein